MAKSELKDTIFVGGDKDSLALYSRLKRPGRVLGFFCDTEVELPLGAERLGAAEDVPVFLERNPYVKRVYCGTVGIGLESIRSLQESCKIRAVRFCAVLPVVNELGATFVPMHVGRQLLLATQVEPLSRLYNLLLKRIFDFVVSLVLLLTIFPVVYLLHYIRVKSRRLGTAIRAQRCMGPNGRVIRRFTFWDVEEGRTEGMCLLPQLMNVFCGSMSLVGPAPTPVSGDAEASPKARRMERSYVKPGMTGWAQVRKSEGEKVLRDDIWYVEHWSLGLDIRILFQSLLQK